MTFINLYGFRKGKEPHYATAKAAEQNAVLRGSYYFHGVGR